MSEGSEDDFASLETSFVSSVSKTAIGGNVCMLSSAQLDVSASSAADQRVRSRELSGISRVEYVFENSFSHRKFRLIELRLDEFKVAEEGDISSLDENFEMLKSVLVAEITANSVGELVRFAEIELDLKGDGISEG